jgi:cyclase
MSGVPYTHGLHLLGGGVHAYLQPPGTWGLSNSGVVAGDGEALLVDTMFTLDMTARLLADVADALPDARVTTVVNTHPNGDHCWGNQLLPDAEIIATPACADGMAHEIPPAAMTAMREQAPAGTPVGDYMRRYFGRFDFGGITLTPATRTFTGRLDLSVGGRPVELVEVGPAHTEGDLVVHVPDAGVLFAGDVLFIGDHPIMWSGPADSWVRACDTILATGATTVVPGHGPVTDPDGVRAFRDYLTGVAEAATGHAHRGTPFAPAAAAIARDCPPGLGHPERLAITVGTVYRNLGVPDAPDRLAAITAMAHLHADGG